MKVKRQIVWAIVNKKTRVTQKDGLGRLLVYSRKRDATTRLEHLYLPHFYEVAKRAISTVEKD